MSTKVLAVVSKGAPRRPSDRDSCRENPQQEHRCPKFGSVEHISLLLKSWLAESRGVTYPDSRELRFVNHSVAQLQRQDFIQVRCLARQESGRDLN